ncbi:MAG TPA: hypothetical protein VG095_08680, partial [Chthoniobacterales bacterium]|nr:hypothetical protein [Chthoniobacterales bacterium]
RRIAVPMISRILLLVACFSAAPALLADIPWPEVKKRVAEENARLASRPGGHGGTYFVVCTIYYTPIETGFTAERGFDVTPQEAPGLGGAKFPRDFLRAVKLEGYGRIATAVKGKNYIAYHAGRYAYANTPRARGITPLEPRVSAAVRLGRGGLPNKAEVITTAPHIQEVFGANRWKIVDTGGGLKRWQLDLYWGEDEPLMPERLGRPRGTEFEYGYSEVKVVERDALSSRGSPRRKKVAMTEHRAPELRARPTR